MHFFNPAPAMKLVEVVRTVLTADDVHATARAVATAVRKHPVDCGDRAGFIVNALLFPYLNNAIKMVQEHYASLDDIDAAMKLGGGYPMGPFELLDVVGLDVSLAIERVLHREFRDPGLAPAPLLEHLVARAASAVRQGAASANTPGADRAPRSALRPMDRSHGPVRRALHQVVRRVVRPALRPHGRALPRRCSTFTSCPSPPSPPVPAPGPTFRRVPQAPARPPSG